MKIPISDENSFPNLNKLKQTILKNQRMFPNQSEKFYFSMKNQEVNLQKHLASKQFALFTILLLL